MSSRYRILCVSHSPAIALSADWGNPDEPATIAANPRNHEETAGHEACDLVIGRYSYPLIEVGCPARPHDEEPSVHQPWHPNDVKWIDVKWLRLLLAAQNSPELRSSEVLQRIDDCWNSNRLNALRGEL